MKQIDLLITFALLFFAFESYACLNPIDVTNAQAIIESGLGPEISCKSSDCTCADGIDWNLAELQDEIVNGKPFYGPKENVVECATMEACDELQFNHCREFPDHEFFYAENLILSGFEAYCTKIIGYTKVKTGKKILVNSHVKKAAHGAKLAKEKKDKDDEKAANLAKKVKAKADMDAATAFQAYKKAHLEYLDAVEKE